MNRSKTQSVRLRANFDRLDRAYQAGLLFAVDEIIVNIYNVFIAPMGPQMGDEEILEKLIELSYKCGNSKNAVIIRNELSRFKTDGVGSYRRENIQILKVILSEDIRTQIRNLIIDSNIFCHGLSLPEQDSNYIEDFERRFFSCSNTYEVINPTKQSTVLDIGTGMGTLPYIFKENGHDVYTFDIPNCSKIYTKSCEILGVEKEEFTIKAFTKLMNFNKKFDIVVAKFICFNNHKSPDLWKRNEWLYFLEDIYENQLEDEGVLWLGFNEEKRAKEFLGIKELHDLFDPFMLPKGRFARLTKIDIGELLFLNKMKIRYLPAVF